MRLHHRVEGPPDAPALVLSASLGTTLEAWEPQAAVLTGAFRVVRYDRRGHGSSPVPPGPYSLDELGRDALELLDDLEVERASWCGLSLGGLVGLWLGVEAPERIDRLVLACTTAAFLPREQWLERAQRVRAEGVAAIADAVVARWFTRLRSSSTASASSSPARRPRATQLAAKRSPTPTSLDDSRRSQPRRSS